MIELLEEIKKIENGTSKMSKEESISFIERIKGKDKSIDSVLEVVLEKINQS